MEESQFEKLIVAQLMNKFPVFCIIINFITVFVYKIPPIDPILDHLTPVHTLTPYFLKINFNILTLKWCLPFRWNFRLKHYIHLSSPQCVLHVSCTSYSLICSSYRYLVKITEAFHCVIFSTLTTVRHLYVAVYLNWLQADFRLRNSLLRSAYDTSICSLSDLLGNIEAISAETNRIWQRLCTKDLKVEWVGERWCCGWSTSELPKVSFALISAWHWFSHDYCISWELVVRLVRGKDIDVTSYRWPLSEIETAWTTLQV
jgi:hypothetical protein